MVDEHGPLRGRIAADRWPPERRQQREDRVRVAGLGPSDGDLGHAGEPTGAPLRPLPPPAGAPAGAPRQAA
jgi:hypothetical protein